tara:strand:- start:165 stop:287 length:123 start_codon:yes stop_codon:yes gene_type:complete
MHTSHIEGISEIEGRNLLDKLLEAATTSKKFIDINGKVAI